MHQKLHVGTSGWSYKDWVGVFYPQNTKAADYLGYYSQRFNTVEIDSTFYGIPRITTVQKWYDSTPPGFIFSPKVPQVITHEKRLVDCGSEWSAFIETIAVLRNKLGPLVLQFDYKFSFDVHLKNLKLFLELIKGEDFRICVEIRNRHWHRAEFYELLREHNVALVLNDLYYLPRVVELTADFTYIRLLGNRRQIPDDFTHIRVDRDKDLNWWANWVKQFLEKELEVYVYSNNRYQGFAPSTINSFDEKLSK